MKKSIPCRAAGALFGLVLAALMQAAVFAPALTRAGDALPDLAAHDRLVIETAAGAEHIIRVEMAVTPRERARGLMFRTELADDAGMLFNHDREAELFMWMRNTLIPLDMIFIGADGTIRHIHPNAIPQDETPISSRVPVRAVLELKGGMASRLDIAPGDHVRHPVFENAGGDPAP